MGFEHMYKHHTPPTPPWATTSERRRGGRGSTPPQSINVLLKTIRSTRSAYSVCRRAPASSPRDMCIVQPPPLFRGQA